jgi:DNA-binding response OmpR family regulator
VVEDDLAIQSLVDDALSDAGLNVEWMRSGEEAKRGRPEGPHSLMLLKPFAPAQLGTAVSQLLNMGPSTLPEGRPRRTCESDYENRRR